MKMKNIKVRVYIKRIKILKTMKKKIKIFNKITQNFKYLNWSKYKILQFNHKIKI
jgi:hypothetical protein